MRYLLLGIVALIFATVALSFVPGSALVDYENKGLGLITTVTSIVITVGALVTAVLFGLRRPGFLLWFIAGLPRPWWPAWGLMRRRTYVLTRLLVLHAIAESFEPGPRAGKVIHEALIDFDRNERLVDDHPIRPGEFGPTNIRLQGIEEKLRDSAVARFLMQERAATIAQLLTEVHDVIEDLAQTSPVSIEEYGRKLVSDSDSEAGANSGDVDISAKLFRNFVTKFTGAIMFVDAVHARSGYARGIRILHRGPFRNGKSANSGVAPATYESSHVHANKTAACALRTEFRAQSKTSPDDFDGHVIEVLGAELSRDNRQSGVFFTITTGESCYAATEVSKSGSGADNPLRSKGLSPEESDEHAPVWLFDDKFMRVDRKHTVDGRVALGVVSVMLIQESTDDMGRTERSVVLLKRPPGSDVRNGGDVLAPPGGVITINANSPESDSDERQIPDPTKAAINECREEVGIRIARDEMIPISVYLANDRGPSNRCQLVSTFAFQATIARSRKQLSDLRHRVSSHAGKYESHGYEFVEIPTEEDLGRMTKSDKAREARVFARRWLELSPQLDQRAIVGALYLAANLFGARETEVAFLAEWGEPWHRKPWTSDAENGAPVLGRLARPISLLAPKAV